MGCSQGTLNAKNPSKTSADGTKTPTISPDHKGSDKDVANKGSYKSLTSQNSLNGKKNTGAIDDPLNSVNSGHTLNHSIQEDETELTDAEDINTLKSNNKSERLPPPTGGGIVQTQLVKATHQKKVLDVKVRMIRRLAHLKEGKP